jgi:hypothetical protein
MTNPMINRFYYLQRRNGKKTNKSKNDKYDNYLLDYMADFIKLKKKKKDIFDKNIMIEKNNKVDDLFKVYF